MNSASASEVFDGSVFVRMSSQWLRMTCSRSTIILPWSICFLSAAMRSDRSFQFLMSGPAMIQSPSNSVTHATAAIISAFWRFLISIGVASFPLEIKRELQRRLAADQFCLQITDFRRGQQLVLQFDIRLIVARHAGAGHG